MSSDHLISFWDIQRLFLFLPQTIKVESSEKLLERCQLSKGVANIIATCISLPLLVAIAFLSTRPFVKAHFGFSSWIGVIAGFLFLKGTIAFVVVKSMKNR